jgi:hypothetical protein
MFTDDHGHQLEFEKWRPYFWPTGFPCRSRRGKWPQRGRKITCLDSGLDLFEPVRRNEGSNRDSGEQRTDHLTVSQGAGRDEAVDDVEDQIEQRPLGGYCMRMTVLI